MRCIRAEQHIPDGVRRVIDEIIKARENEFSRIQARFKTRLSLSSSSADEVIQKRILLKADEAEHDLEQVYAANDSVLRNLFSFTDAILDIKGYTGAGEFAKNFPFVPYQFILMLVKKYHDSHCDDKEVLITIQKAIDASPELRSKKALIENFIAGINDVTDVMVEWREYVAQEKERQLTEIIRDENLKENETRQFMEISFRDGAVKTTGTDIDKLLPPMSRFGGGNRAEKKQGVIAKLLGFFERFFGIG